VPRDGQPIVLGVDCQTIGGYPRLAQVIRADLDLLGQLRPGVRVRFQVVSLAEAEALDQAQREELRRWINRTTVASHLLAGA
jgi:allophanate hydrolase subunit 2